MSKYMYCDGKIKEIFEYTTRIEVVRDTGITSYPKQEFYKICSDAQIVENITDLIEVGDIIRFEYISIFDKGLAFRIVDDDVLNQIKFGDYFSKYSRRQLIELYKHMGKNYIRICHKEGESWVID